MKVEGAIFAKFISDIPLHITKLQQHPTLTGPTVTKTQMQCNCVRFCYQTLFLVLVRREGIEQECEGEGGVRWKQQVTSSWKVGRTVSPRVSGVILAQLPQMRPMKWAQTRRFLELLLFS